MLSSVYITWTGMWAIFPLPTIIRNILCFQQSKANGAQFINKMMYPVITQGSTDYTSHFINVEVGHSGPHHDVHIFKQSSLCAARDASSCVPGTPLSRSSESGYHSSSSRMLRTFSGTTSILIAVFPIPGIWWKVLLEGSRRGKNA